MNFKDIYKEANNEIKGDRSILERLYKKEKISLINIVKPLATCAASLILVVAVSSFYDFCQENTEQNALTKEITNSQNIPSSNTESTEKNNFNESYNINKSNSKTRLHSESKKDDVSVTSDMSKNSLDNPPEKSPQPLIKEDSSSKNDAFSESETTTSYDIAPASLNSGADSQNLYSEDEEISENEFSNEKDSLLGETQGAAGGKNSKTGKADTANEIIISFNEFLSLSAFNIETLSLEGFTIYFPENAKIIKAPDNNSEYYSADITLQNEDKKIIVTISEKISEQAPYVEKYENTIHAFFSSGENNIFVNAENVDYEEIDEYIKKLHH